MACIKFIKSFIISFLTLGICDFIYIFSRRSPLARKGYNILSYLTFSKLTALFEPILRATAGTEERQTSPRLPPF